MTKDTIGIDISKATLDVFWHSRDTARIFPNSDEGFIQLCNWLKKPNKMPSVRLERVIQNAIDYEF